MLIVLLYWLRIKNNLSVYHQWNVVDHTMEYFTAVETNKSHNMNESHHLYQARVPEEYIRNYAILRKARIGQHNSVLRVRTAIDHLWGGGEGQGNGSKGDL